MIAGVTIAAVLLLCSLGFYLIAIIGAGSRGGEELPMLGDAPKFEYSLARAHTKWVVLMNGSVEKAFEERWRAGWAWFSRKQYRWAMKVFNRAWLINPQDVRIFNAYGAIYDVQGKKQEAIEWYRKGAESGDPKCQYNLAEQYFEGKNLKRNYIEAAKWYRLAADQNLDWALNMIGYCYEYGLGVPRSVEEARRWYAKADAEGGIPKEMLERRGLPQSEITEFEIPPEGEMVKE